MAKAAGETPRKSAPQLLPDHAHRCVSRDVCHLGRGYGPKPKELDLSPTEDSQDSQVPGHQQAGHRAWWGDEQAEVITTSSGFKL